jgi:putative Mg2+ transporter-C (MgtC) family protein
VELTQFQGEIALRLGLAAIAGAAIGLEREMRAHPAGLRTHLLVAVGSCLFALVSAYGFEALAEGRAAVQADPSRIASNIVTGIGFLGAGTIIRDGGSVRGLTTAASLWIVAALGMAIAFGMYFATGVAGVITLVSLWALRPVRRRLRRGAEEEDA